MVDQKTLLKMKEAAKEASRRAYCVYSSFPVGSAVLTDEGDVISGCNVENASFGLTICAERNAIFHAVATGHRSIRALVVFTPTESPSAPCGACRQVISEFNPHAEVYSYCNTEARLACNLRDLLPHAFGPDAVSNGELGSGSDVREREHT